MPDVRSCSRCHAKQRERDLPHLEDDLVEHTMMVEAAHHPESRCAVLGRSLLNLRKAGQKLSVDRIDSAKGYVPGNMQLLALDLNVAKRDGTHIPQAVIHMILTKLERTKDDRLSDVPGATHAD